MRAFRSVGDRNAFSPVSSTRRRRDAQEISALLRPLFPLVLSKAANLTLSCYASHLSGLVMQESYVQDVETDQPVRAPYRISLAACRTGNSSRDLLLVRREGSDAWMQSGDRFRSGRQGADAMPQTGFEKLFLSAVKSTADAGGKKKTSGKTHRYNIGDIETRRLDLPLLAMTVLDRRMAVELSVSKPRSHRRHEAAKVRVILPTRPAR